jgi:hypothetical protein
MYIASHAQKKFSVCLMKKRQAKTDASGKCGHMNARQKVKKEVDVRYTVHYKMGAIL